MKLGVGEGGGMVPESDTFSAVMRGGNGCGLWVSEPLCGIRG